MSERLPIYRENPRAAIEDSAPLDLDHSCSRCSLSERVPDGKRCIPADGDPGGLLVIGDMTSEDARNGRVFTSAGGREARAQIGKLWNGPVAFDVAVRCPAPKDGASEKHVAACRPFLAGVVRDVRPTRILCLGADAARAVLGRSPPAMSVRRGYAHTSSGVPVFLLLPPSRGLRNRFVRQWFADDLRWALTAQPAPAPLGGVARIVRTPDDARAAVAELRAARWFAFDCETFGRMFCDEFRVVALAACAVGSDDAWVWDTDALADSSLADPLRALLADPRARKVAQNAKFDMLAVRSGLGVPVRGVVGDTRLWRKIIDGEADARLEVMQELVGMGGGKAEAEAALSTVLDCMRKRHRDDRRTQAELTYSAAGALHEDIDAAARFCAVKDLDLHAVAYAFIERDTLLRYNALDAISTARLGALFEEQIAAEGLGGAWDVMLGPALDAIEQVEAWGIAVAPESMRAFDAYLRARKSEIEGKFAAWEVDPASTKSLREFLYGKLKLKPPHETETGAPSTNAEALDALRGKHEAVDVLLTWRKLTTMEKFAGGMLSHVREDRRIHPSFNLDGARSGRLSCSAPNLQNIPSPSRDPEFGRMARDCFIAPPGHVLLQADYSQLELRIAAALSGDPEMRAIYDEGVDFHQRTAELIAPLVWKIQPEAVTKQHRSAAKAFNFGLLYGMGDAGLAERAGCTVAEARRIRDAILGKFKMLAKWIQRQLSEARRTGYVWTYWNGMPLRRRSLWQIGDADDAARVVAEHGSWNSAIQGTGSDYCLASLVEIVRWIHDDAVPAKLVLSVHDSILLEVREDAVEEAAWQMQRIMRQWPANGVPLDVDLEIGTAWGSMDALPSDLLARVRA